MAHEIDMTTGKAAIAYVGATPWHGMGFELEAGASIYEWLQASGLYWSLESAPVQYQNGELHSFPGKRVLYRSDTKAPMAVVSDRYREVQPEQILEFFRDLVEAGDFQLETAGSLFDGAVIWALAKINRIEAVAPGDQVAGYLLLSTSCDGSQATTAQFTTVRVVCNNTLKMASREKDLSRVTIPHSTTFDHKAVKAQLGIASQRFDAFLTESQALAQKFIKDSAVDDFVQLLLKDRTDAADITKTRAYQDIKANYYGAGIGSNLPGSEGTAWGLVNAVTQYIDHGKRSRTPDARLYSAWFDDGARMKDEAFQMALSMPSARSRKR